MKKNRIEAYISILKTKMMNAKLTVTKITQLANKELGFPEKQKYYLIIETAKGKLQINIGEKTHDTIKTLTT